MRITSGLAKGYKLKIPPGDRVRPAQDIVRQAIFNLLGEHIVNAKVLDLFAGSGSLGIEALSRGAAWCDFVDKDKHCTQVIKENLRHTHFKDKAKVYTLKAERLLDETDPNTYDFIFLSPPYVQGIDLDLLKKMVKVLRGGGVVVFEHAKETYLPTDLKSLELIDERTYGAATISFLQKTNPTPKYPS